MRFCRCVTVMVNRGNTQDLSSLQVFGMMKCNRAHVFDVFSVVISSLSSSLQLFVYFSFCCALLCRSSSRSGSRCEIHIQPVGLACKPSSWASKKFSLYHSFFSQTLTILRLFSNLFSFTQAIPDNGADGFDDDDDDDDDEKENI